MDVSEEKSCSSDSSDVTLHYEEVRRNAIEAINKHIPGFVRVWEEGPAIGRVCDTKVGEIGKENMGEVYKSMIADFVKLWERGPTQRTKAWYDLVGKTIGGSEIAAILGADKYRDVYAVAKNKLETLWNYDQVELNNMSSAVACQWGTVFEDVIKEIVEYDLQTTVQGDSVCLQIHQGHRTSPDGYCVIAADSSGRLVSKIGRGSATQFCGEKPVQHGHTCKYDRCTDISFRKRLRSEADAKGLHEVSDKYIALLEFKCPWRRMPDGKICDNYVPQVLSGLAVSPCAHVGLFVDAVIRVSPYSSLGFDTTYNKRIHLEKSVSGWPIAWGLIGIYAPTLSAPQEMRIFNPRDMPGVTLSILEIVQNMYHEFACTSKSNCGEFIDFGSIGNESFETLFDCILRKMLKIVRAPPIFRSADADNINLFDYLHKHSPEMYGLVGVLPWKAFSVDYCFVQRDPQFLSRVLPKIDKLHESVQSVFDEGRDVASVLDGTDPLDFTDIPELSKGIHRYKSGSPKTTKYNKRHPTEVYKKYLPDQEDDYQDDFM